MRHKWQILAGENSSWQLPTCHLIYWLWNQEIAANNKVELCTLGDENEVLRIAGQLESENHFTKNVLDDIKNKMFVSIPQLQEFFKGPEDPSIIIYRLKVAEIIFRHEDNNIKSELNFHKV